MKTMKDRAKVSTALLQGLHVLHGKKAINPPFQTRED